MKQVQQGLVTKQQIMAAGKIQHLVTAYAWLPYWANIPHVYTILTGCPLASLPWQLCLLFPYVGGSTNSLRNIAHASYRTIQFCMQGR
jgi:hypothetical protein